MPLHNLVEEIGGQIIVMEPHLSVERTGEERPPVKLGSGPHLTLVIARGRHEKVQVLAAEGFAHGIVGVLTLAANS